MAYIDIASFNADRIVLHFGGDTNAIDAETFARSLLGFVEMARAVDGAINPHQEIEILVEAEGGGSYRTTIRRIAHSYGGFFSEGAKAIFWSIVATIIYDHFIKNDPDVKVVINTDEVLIYRGFDRIVVPRQTYDAARNATKNPEVQTGLERTFEPLERNPRVTDFGLTQSLTDPTPLLQIPREKFQLFTNRTAVTVVAPEAERVRTEKARVVIVKAWLNHKRRKWTFEWNGVPISAPITDEKFLDKIERREYLIGAGDALDVEVTFRQHYDPKIGTYINDPHSFVISRVLNVLPNE